MMLGFTIDSGRQSWDNTRYQDGHGALLIVGAIAFQKHIFAVFWINSNYYLFYENVSSELACNWRLLHWKIETMSP